MKKFTSLLLSVFIALGAAVPNVYAADPDPVGVNEESKNLKEGISEREQSSQYDSFSEKIKTEFFGIEETADPELKTMDGNTYSEYVYIGSAADLRAIDGHDGGYYEFARDITLTDADWKPVKLTNAVVNGKGHWVYGLSQSGDDATGLFAWDITSTESKSNIYVANLNLSDVNINASGSGDLVLAGALGGYGITAENCYVSGKLNANPSGAQKVLAIGIGNGINSQARLDIKVGGRSEKTLSVSGLADCKNCAMEGDITVSGTHRDWDIYGATYCKNTKVKDFIGDITVSGKVIPGDEYDGYVYGDSNCCIRALYHCEKMDFTGDIDASVGGESSLGDDLYTEGICYGKECNMRGNFDIRSVSNEKFSVYSYLIIGSDKCSLKGAVNVKASGLNGSGIYMIHTSDNSSYDGSLRYDISNANFEYHINGIYADRPSTNYKNDTVKCNMSGSGKSEFNGIMYTDNSTYIGNVSVTGKIYGIGGKSQNSEIRGNLHTKGELTSEGGFTGIAGNSYNCKIYGDISSESLGVNGRRYYAGGTGIYYSEKCSVYGNISAKFGEVHALSYCKNCYVSGTVSTVLSYSVKSGVWDYVTYYHDMFVSSAVPYQGVFVCSECGHEVVSAVNMEGITHCTRARDGYEYKYERKAVMEYEVDSRNDKDSENNYINYVPEPDPVDYTLQIVRVEDGKPLEGAKVSVDGDDFVTDDDGCCKVKGGNSYEAALAVEYGGAIVYKNLVFNPVPNTKNVVKVCDFNIEFDPGASQERQTEGPEGELNGKKFEIFELNSSFGITLPGAVKVSYDANRKAYRILFGNLGKIDKQEDISDKEFEDKYKQLERFYKKAVDGKLNGDAFTKINSSGKQGFGVPVIGAASGYMELQKVVKDGKEQIAATGGIVLTGSAFAEGSTPFPPFPAVYLAYGISGTVEGGVSLSLVGTNFNDLSINPAGRLSLIITPKLGVGLGARKVASVEAGITGTIRGDLLLPFETLEKSYSAKLTADVYATLSLLGFDNTWSHTYVKWPIFPEVGKIEINPLEAFSEDDMQQADRSYLKNTAQDDREGTVKSNVYPHSKVCYTPTNGGDLMVWLDDDPERADADRTALFYSIKYTNGSWSEPKQIYNDGTADFDFALYHYSGDVYLVWQNANKKLDGTSISDTAKNIDIYTCVLPYRSSDWSTPVAVTSGNSDYEYSPDVIFTSNGEYIMWKQNDKNSVIPSLDGAKETIYRAYIKRNTSVVDSVETPLADTPLVLETIFANGKEIAYIADKDGDPDTEGNVFGITGQGVLYDNDTEIHSLSRDDNYNDEYYFAEGNKLIRTSNGSAAEIFTADSDIVNIDVIGDSSHKAAVYETSSGFDTSVYALYNTDGKTWSKNPLLIGKFDEAVRSWDAFLPYSSNNIGFAAVLADVKVAKDYSQSDKEMSVDNSVSESVRLARLSLEPKQDISADYIMTDDDIVRGATVSFDIGVTNETMDDISALNVTVSDDKGNTLFNSTANGSLIAGKSGVFTVDAKLPDDFTSGNITAEISVKDLTESDTTNNTVSATFGGADMTVGLRGAAMRKTGFISVAAQNIGTMDATNVKVEIYDENGSIIHSEDLGTIEAGEKVKLKAQVSDELAKSKQDVTLTAKVSCSEEELYEYNNTDTAVIAPEEEIPDDPDEGFLFGDVDCDNVVTASDAAAVMQKTLLDSFKMTIENKTENWLKYSDVDCDNSVTASDAACILQKTLLDNYKLPAESAAEH